MNQGVQYTAITTAESCYGDKREVEICSMCRSSDLIYIQLMQLAEDGVQMQGGVMVDSHPQLPVNSSNSNFMWLSGDRLSQDESRPSILERTPILPKSAEKNDFRYF